VDNHLVRTSHLASEAIADSLGKIWVFNLSRYGENTSGLVHNDDVLILKHNFDVLKEASKR
jgi:hypothetical protein